MANQNRLILTTLIVVFVFSFKVIGVFSNNSTASEIVIKTTDSNNNGTEYEGYGSELAANNITNNSTKLILDLYESAVENNNVTESDKTSSAPDVLVPTPTATPPRPPTTPSPPSPPPPSQKVPSIQVSITTTAATPTSTLVPDTTSNPQQMLIPPALVNASIAQMPSATYSKHKQGQIIIR